MQLPMYVRRPLKSAAARGMYHGEFVIGYVSPTMTAWFAQLDDSGVIVDGCANLCQAGDFRHWARRLEREARRRGEKLTVVELGDDAVASVLQHLQAVH